MRIAICDNDIDSCNRLNKYLHNYELKNEIRLDVTVFHTGEEMLLSKRKFDIVFLEYKLPKANGIKIIKKLRSRSNDFQVIFTSSSDVILESFEVFPYRFFLKPVNERKIHLALDSMFWQKNSLTTLTIIEDNKQKIIPSREIIYLEGDGKHCIIRTKHETLRSSKTLSEILAQLPKNSFFRIHKSYVVNLQYIAYVGNKYVTLVNGEKALISKSRIDEFNIAYKKFINNLYLTPYLNI